MYVYVHVCVLYSVPQSTKPGGTIPLLQCYRVFDPRSKGLQVSYCLGMEVLDSVYYIKAETAAMYNIWLDVSVTVLCAQYCMYMFNARGRKKEASKVKQTTRQSNTAHPSTLLHVHVHVHVHVAMLTESAHVYKVEHHTITCTCK